MIDFVSAGLVSLVEDGIWDEGVEGFAADAVELAGALLSLVDADGAAVGVFSLEGVSADGVSAGA